METFSIETIISDGSGQLEVDRRLCSGHMAGIDHKHGRNSRFQNRSSPFRTQVVEQSAYVIHSSYIGKTLMFQVRQRERCVGS